MGDAERGNMAAPTENRCVGRATPAGKRTERRENIERNGQRNGEQIRGSRRVRRRLQYFFFAAL